MRAHVIYESQPELTRLFYANFDKDVTTILGNPFPSPPPLTSILRWGLVVEWPGDSPVMSLAV
jgi:hypothetical protein